MTIESSIFLPFTGCFSLNCASPEPPFFNDEQSAYECPRCGIRLRWDLDGGWLASNFQVKHARLQLPPDTQTLWWIET